MTNTEFIRNLPDSTIYEDVTSLLLELGKIIFRKQNYIAKIQREGKHHEGIIRLYEKEITTLKCIRKFFEEMLNRYQIQSTIIPIELWRKAIRESEIVGELGSLGFFIEISNFEIITQNIITK